MSSITDLNDGRAVYFDGALVNVAEVPIFQKTLAVVNTYYDLQRTNPKLHTYQEDGQTFATAFMTPRSATDLQKKRAVYTEIAQASYGMLGRTPDFIASGLAVLGEKADFLGKSKYADFAANAKRYAERIKKGDIFVSHALQNPQLDRSKALNAIPKGYAGVHTVDHDEKGIYVSGAKMVNTLAPIADELLVFNPPELLLDAGDTSYGLAFAAPLNLSGAKIVCRKPLNHPGYSENDYPLSNAFDEIDAYVLFDHAFIPWTDVFVYNDYAMSNRFFVESGMFIHTAHQDEVRGVTKLEFVTSLAIRVAKALGLADYLGVAEQLGELTSNLELIKGTIVNSELNGQLDEQGIFAPSEQALTAVRDSLPKMYEKALQVIQHLAAGSMVAIPDFREFSGDNATILRQAYTSEKIGAEDRAKLLNLAFDVSSAAFGQRQLMYEYYHGGDPKRIRANHFQHEDLTAGMAMLERILKLK
ncbi:4-hydroxyphenylacetate 3-hydroxylase N-terminal domain-containing protein [Loigolactobacillus iwatensis]|uniref:4-hydroxyphenylacetate 3-hydroxylase N-terminal domain-containing protein n=1 Tax=Loigolactobacillus iwatensis TaxID=1267156 RepID=UPI000F7F512C|nr:4-hydroxyphenylacetate 3-hydroxylase N-terminal domain-containing protein [Loigolactobacillus iwatensis]